MPLQRYGVPLSYHFHHVNDVPTNSTTRPILVIFVNGLVIPQAMWLPTINLLKSSLTAAPVSVPIYAITYDRYGQGESVPQNDQQWKPEPHDIVSAANELSDVITSLGADIFPIPSPWPKIVMASHSIGVPLVRLHDERSWPRVHGHLFLDSNIANTNFVSLFPDPEADGFDASQLPHDTAIEDLQAMREKVGKMFRPSVPNPENLDRSSLPHLLPHSDEPKLHGPNDTAPFLTVVGHDPVAFAEEGLRLTGTPRGLNEMYMQPAWDEYNAGLLKLGQPERTKTLVIAKGSGHFVQRDNPQCIADEIVDLIRKVMNDSDHSDPSKERHMR